MTDDAASVPPIQTETSVPGKPARASLWKRKWPAFLIAGVAFLFFWQYFLQDQTLYAGDTTFVFLPFRHYLMERLGRGELPLWNPYLFGGTPALAESQYQVFYLPNLLLFLTGVPRGMGWLLPLHMAFMGAGAYLFARRSLALDRPAATLTAVTLAFGGAVQSHQAISVYAEAAAWMPWMLLAYDAARRRGGAALLLPGCVLAIQLVTGAPQYAYYTLALLLAYHLYRWHEARLAPAAPGSDRRFAGGWLALLLTLVGGAALAAAQLLPELELARLSDRGTHASYSYVTEFSLLPRHFFAAMLFPKFWGSFSAPFQDGYTGEEMGYLGILPLGLCAAALAAARPSEASHRAVLFWGVVALVSVLLAFGGNNPLYPLLYRWLPGTAIFRAPARWLLVTSFAGAALAGLGLQAVLSPGPRGQRAARAAFAAFAGLLVIASALLFSPWGEPALQTPQMPYGPWGQVALLAAAAALLGARCFTRGAASETLLRRLPAAALLLLVVDLFAVSLDMEIQHTLPVEALESKPETARLLESQPVRERFWSGHDEVPMEIWLVPSAAGRVSPMEFRARAAAAVSALMPSCIPAQYDSLGLTGAWGALMPLRRHPRPIYHPETPADVQLRWLRLLNVRRYLSLRPITQSGLVAESGEPPFVARDPLALPRAFTVPAARSVKGEEAIGLISDPAFDPRREALLEDEPGVPLSSGSQDAGSFAGATLDEQNPERLQLQTNAPGQSCLVLMDTFYPGWKATVDGREATLVPANWLGRGLRLSPGPHQVRMTFEPSSFRSGLFTTLLSLAFLGGAAAAAPRRHPRRRA